MAKVIQVKSDLDFTGSNGGKDIPCWRFDGEPTKDQQDYCSKNGISMEWANGKTQEWNGMRNIDGSWNIGDYSRGGHNPTEPISSIDKFIYIYMMISGALLLIAWIITR